MNNTSQAPQKDPQHTQVVAEEFSKCQSDFQKLSNLQDDEYSRKIAEDWLTTERSHDRWIESCNEIESLKQKLDQKEKEMRKCIFRPCWRKT